MRLRQPRVVPTVEADWDIDSRPLMLSLERNGRELNIFRTLARHPKLLKRWLVFANHVLAGSTLPARERELIILRTGVRCGSGYEWAQHVAIARNVGVTDDEIRRLADGSTRPGTDGWSSDDATLIRAADELLDDKFISEATWSALSTRWNQQQLMDIVFTIGQYTLVSMALNTLGVQIEAHTEQFPPELFVDGLFTARPATS
ncbi:MAG: carboxymuconolactone decarboxylase family protein [Ilumatobacteraceae bacterium]